MRQIKLSNTVKVVVPAKISAQIMYLCSKIHDVEWSGVLFYSVTGNINKPDTKIKLEYIYPMDKGTGGSTGFEYDEKVVEFMMDNPETIQWKQGLVHSHNNMQAYHSGTDMSELEDNSKNHNYYLSIVINNKFDIVGKIGFEGKLEASKLKYMIRNDSGKPSSLVLNQQEEKVLFYRECEFEFEGFDKEEYSKKVDTIINKSIQTSLYGDRNGIVSTVWKDDNIPAMRNNHKEKTDIQKHIDSIGDMFFIYFLSQGHTTDVKEVDDYLNAYEIEDRDRYYTKDTQVSISEEILSKFKVLYRQFCKRYNVNKEFTEKEAIDYIIDSLEVYEVDYYIVDELINGLEELKGKGFQLNLFNHGI